MAFLLGLTVRQQVIFKTAVVGRVLFHGTDSLIKINLRRSFSVVAKSEYRD